MKFTSLIALCGLTYLGQAHEQVINDEYHLSLDERRIMYTNLFEYAVGIEVEGQGLSDFESNCMAKNGQIGAYY
jgi:hypothetical protein